MSGAPDDVDAVTDFEGDVWTRDPITGLWRWGMFECAWPDLLAWGPLTPVLVDDE